MPEELNFSPWVYAVFTGAVVTAMLESCRTVTVTVFVRVIPARS